MIFHRRKSLIFQSLQNPLILQKTHDSVRLFVLFYSSSKKIPTESTNVILNLLEKHDFSPRNASKVASSLSRLKDAQKCDSVINFFKDAGFSAAQLERTLIKMPNLLAYNLHRTIKPKMKIFGDLGFSATDIADILSADPGIFTRSALNRIGPSIMALKKVLGSISEVAKVLKTSGAFLRCDLDKTMLPNIEYLNNCGINTKQIVKFLYHCPRFILHRPENMKKFVEKAEEKGCSRDSRMLIYGVRTIASMNEEHWKQKLKLFGDLGFSEEQIILQFQKSPQVFAVSCNKIRKAVRLILEDGKYDISDIFHSPLIFICSVEKTLKPRLHVLDILVRKNLLKKPPPFYVTHNITKQMFFFKYIVPYLSEVDEFRRLDDWRKEISKLDSIVCSKLDGIVCS